MNSKSIRTVIGAMAALGASFVEPKNTLVFRPCNVDIDPPPTIPPQRRKRGEKYPGQSTAYLQGTNNAHKRDGIRGSVQRDAERR